MLCVWLYANKFVDVEREQTSGTLQFKPNNDSLIDTSLWTVLKNKTHFSALFFE